MKVYPDVMRHCAGNPVAYPAVAHYRTGAENRRLEMSGFLVFEVVARQVQIVGRSVKNAFESYSIRNGKI